MTKTQATKILSVGNHKLSTHIASWTLPASKEVCGRECEGCYAIKAQKIYPAVLPSRERKLALSKTPEFVGVIVEAIRKLRPKFVRIHDSGEFYSQEYVDKWVTIAKHFPKVTFYAYTKRLKDFDFSTLMSLNNVVIIDSLHGNRINYGDLGKKPDGMFLCPDHKHSEMRKKTPSGPICGIECTYCMTKDAQETGVYFVKH